MGANKAALAGFLTGWLGGQSGNVLVRLVDVVYASPSLLLFTIMHVSLRKTWFNRLTSGLIVIFVAFAFAGDRLRDALDPQMSGRVRGQRWRIRKSLTLR